MPSNCYLFTAAGLLFGIIAALLITTGSGGGIEVSLDRKDAGFFLRSPLAEPMGDASDDVDSLERFNLLQPSSPVTIKAQYGPFSVKQTFLPALVTPTIFNASDAESNGLPPLATPRDSDVTAHLVVSEVRRDSPVLRVLFHSGHASEPAKARQSDGQKGVLCIALYVHHKEEHLMAVCSPSANRDGVCLAEVTLPASWWPPLEAGGPWRAVKYQKVVVRLEYAVLRSHALECTATALPVVAPAGVPSIFLSHVTLSPSHGSYEEVKTDDTIRILVPQGPVYPRSKVYVPVYLKRNLIYPLYVIVMRVRVKSGLRILGAQPSQGDNWHITVDLNPKQTVATVTAFIKEAEDAEATEATITEGATQEIFSWLFEVEENAGYHDTGRIVWQVRYVLDSSMSDQYDFDDDSIKMVSRLDIQKDDIQAVLPIAKSTQLLNTAVLTGRQVSHSLRVFVVSQAGRVGDITLQSSCHAADESILKVSPSCTSVYLDGSEIRGSQNASVLVKYGTYTGQAHFLVWMPELPLDVRLSDTKLSQVKGWKTPQLQKRKSRIPPIQPLTTHSSRNDVMTSSKGTADSNGGSKKERWNSEEVVEVVCRLRYQQAHVEVYTRFFSVDHNSGREASLLNRRVAVRVTELVAPFLRVSDPRIASLRGNTVQGQQAGRAEVQVLSAITGRVIGAQEVRVGSDKETITQLEVKVVAGLQLTVRPDEALPNVWVARTAVNNKLTSQYQEGLLDIHLHFSDGSVMPLSDISELDYRLSVDTFDSGVVAFAPMAGLHHPRVIAIGQGKGELLHVSLELSDQCQKRRSQPLAMAYAYIEVDFTTPSRSTPLQNDAILRSKEQPNVISQSDALQRGQDVNSILYQDAINSGGLDSRNFFNEPTVQARQNPDPEPIRSSTSSPLVIGMYALLGVFCLAIVVFVSSCTLFAVRYRRKQVPATGSNSESVAHAHDWVWLGRATLERNSINTRCSQTLMPMADFNGNHPAAGHGSATTPKVQWRDRKVGNGCRSSSISFPGSEISIRITTNPQQLDEEAEDETNSMIERGVITSLTNPNALHLPSVYDAKPSAQQAHENNNNAGALALPVSQDKTTQVRCNVDKGAGRTAKQPPNYMSTFSVPPPVPPHRNNSNAPPPVPRHRHPHGAGPRRGHSTKTTTKSKKEISNVSTLPAHGEVGWESVSKGMNYDQLMEYFDNLKESNA